MNDVSLLIHGPLKEDTYKFYCKFYPEVPKVFSTWINNKKTSSWKDVANLHSPKDIYIESKPPKKISEYENKAELDVVSVLLGLEKVKTKFTIKTKGNEWYSNLNHFCDIMHLNDDKLFMAPIFLKKWEVWPFRISDNILGGKTSNLMLMYQTCLLNIVLGKDFDQRCWPLPYQSLLGMGYVKNKLPNIKCDKAGMKMLFDTISLRNLKFYKVVSETEQEIWYSNFKPFIESVGEI